MTHSDVAWIASEAAREDQSRERERGRKKPIGMSAIVLKAYDRGAQWGVPRGELLASFLELYVLTYIKERKALRLTFA